MSGVSWCRHGADNVLIWDGVYEGQHGAGGESIAGAWSPYGNGVCFLLDDLDWMAELALSELL